MKVIVAIIFVALCSQASAYCRQALILALDVSGSVNSTEYAQQIEGLSAALQDPRVVDLVLSDPESHVALLAFEWSSQNHQTLIADWAKIASPEDLDQFAATIAAHKRQRAGLKTAIGRALEFSRAKLKEQVLCLRWTIDVSGDGKNNIGPTPSDIYGMPGFENTTVNALVIDDKVDTRDINASSLSVSASSMRRYYEKNVIHGHGAFTEIAYGYDDYADAIRRKLERELQAPVIGQNKSGLMYRRLADVDSSP